MSFQPLKESTADIYTAGRYPCSTDWHLKWKGTRECLFFIEKGEGWVECDGARLKTVPGELHFFRSGLNYELGHNPKKCLTVLSVSFKLHLPGNANAIHSLKLPGKLKLDKKQQSLIKKLYLPVIENFEVNSSSNTLRCKAGMLNLLAQFFEWSQKLPKKAITLSHYAPPAEESRVGKVIQFIEQHFQNDLSLDDLAKQCHLSPSHFAKIFRDSTGSSPIDFVRNRRLDYAKSLLVSGDKSIAEIARESGFEDVHYFSRAFKRCVALSATEYRKSFENPFFQS